MCLGFDTICLSSFISGLGLKGLYKIAGDNDFRNFTN
jgi:hypothetical protein